MDKRHGGPFDRGGADYYYWRSFRPHYFKSGSYTSEIVMELTPEEIAEYTAGWNFAKELGDRKDWR